MEKNKVLNEFKFPEVGIGIFQIFDTSDLFEKSAFINSKVLFKLAHSD